MKKNALSFDLTVMGLNKYASMNKQTNPIIKMHHYVTHLKKFFKCHINQPKNACCLGIKFKLIYILLVFCGNTFAIKFKNACRRHIKMVAFLHNQWTGAVRRATWFLSLTIWLRIGSIVVNKKNSNILKEPPLFSATMTRKKK